MRRSDTRPHPSFTASGNPYGPHSREVPVTVVTGLLLVLALIVLAILS